MNTKFLVPMTFEKKNQKRTLRKVFYHTEHIYMHYRNYPNIYILGKL